jgi:hypothetical protein
LWKSREWAAFITVMNVLQRKDMAADRLLANVRSVKATRFARPFSKLFEKIYAPLTAGLLQPFRGDRVLAEEKRCELDRLYQRVCDDLEALLRAVGLKLTA